MFDNSLVSRKNDFQLFTDEHSSHFRDFRILLKVSLLVFTVLSLQACGNKTLLRVSQDFSDKSAGSTEKVTRFYKGLEEAHSQMRIEEMKVQVEAATPLDPATPGPDCPFSKEHSTNQVKSARFVETMAKCLNGVIHSKNQNEMEQAISDANSQLKGFDLKNFQPLAALRSASTPITTTLKIVGRRGFNVWAGRWYTQALADTDRVLVEQMKVLKLETKADASEAVRRATALQGLAERIYRKRVESKASKDQIDEALDEVKRYSKLKHAVEENPSSIYDELLDVHEQLMQEVPEKLKEPKK